MTSRWVQESLAAGELQSLSSPNNRIIYRPLPFRMPLPAMQGVRSARTLSRLPAVLSDNAGLAGQILVAWKVSCIHPFVSSEKVMTFSCATRSMQGIASSTVVFSSTVIFPMHRQAVRERVRDGGEAVPGAAGAHAGRALHQQHVLRQHPPAGGPTASLRRSHSHSSQHL